jgi:AcrR family transcriptional regulator
MPEREPSPRATPYHHGNLRAVLLDAAERTLREQGIEQVSLRDLARQAGVSHGAPSRHFRDRQALLAELAAVGYERLGDELAAAAEGAADDFGARLRAVGGAYVRFALDNPALLELMVATGWTRESPTEPKPLGRPYVILSELMQWGERTGRLRPGDPERLLLLVIVTFQGVAALIASGSVPDGQADALVAEAAALFTRS